MKNSRATNEESMASNVELQSLNAEYQSKIAEPDDVYADLESLTRAALILLDYVVPVDHGGCVVTHFDGTDWIDPERIMTEEMS